MGLWRFIRRIKPAQLWKLCLLCAANLTKVWPTWRATNKSVAYATKHFGKQHQYNNPANAFRHALWSYLIAVNCLKQDQQKDEIIRWTIKITDMHEDLFPNKPLARAMDIHNNHLGVHYFNRYGKQDEEEIVDLLRDLIRGSVQIKDLKELEMIPEDRMVNME